MEDRVVYGIGVFIAMIAIFFLIAHPTFILWGIGAAIVIFVIMNLGDVFAFMLHSARWLFWPALIGLGIYYFWWRPHHG